MCMGIQPVAHGFPSLRQVPPQDGFYPQGTTRTRSPPRPAVGPSPPATRTYGRPFNYKAPPSLSVAALLSITTIAPK